MQPRVVIIRKPVGNAKQAIADDFVNQTVLHYRRQPMIKAKHPVMFALFVALITTIAACGGSNNAANTPSTEELAPPTQSGTGSVAIEEDAAHQVILVNLHLDGASGGPAYDVYQHPNSQNLEGQSPVVHDLAYGAFSKPLHPGRQSEHNNGTYGLSFAPAGKSTADNIAVLPDDYTRKLTILAIRGSGRTGGAMSFYDEQGGEGSSSIKSANVLPASKSGKVTLLVVSDFVGDKNADTGLNPNDTLLFGTTGKCLTSSDPFYSGRTEPTSVNLPTPFVVDAGTAKVGFWTTKSNQNTPSDCAGKPLAEADISKLKPGSRAMVFLYGPSANQVKALVVPVPD